MLTAAQVQEVDRRTTEILHRAGREDLPRRLARMVATLEIRLEALEARVQACETDIALGRECT